MQEPRSVLTPEQYLEIERKAEYKSEYYNGELFALAGTSKQHNIISSNLIGILYNKLSDKPCQVFHSDIRLKVKPTGLYTYPDIIVVCGEQKFEDDKFDTLLNPTLIIEILSESTKNYDRLAAAWRFATTSGEKFVNYRQIESLKEYVIVSQKTVLVEKYLKVEKDEWLLSESSDREGTIELNSINSSILLKEIYRNIQF